MPAINKYDIPQITCLPEATSLSPIQKLATAVLVDAAELLTNNNQSELYLQPRKDAAAFVKDEAAVSFWLELRSRGLPPEAEELI